MHSFYRKQVDKHVIYKICTYELSLNEICISDPKHDLKK